MTYAQRSHLSGASRLIYSEDSARGDSFCSPPITPQSGDHSGLGGEQEKQRKPKKGRFPRDVPPGGGVTRRGGVARGPTEPAADGEQGNRSGGGGGTAETTACRTNSSSNSQKDIANEVGTAVRTNEDAKTRIGPINGVNGGLEVPGTRERGDKFG